MFSSTIEDYLKAIFWLQDRHEKATTNMIAKQLGVTMPSVTSMIKTLVGAELIMHVPYRGVTLTERGHRLVLELLRRHRLIELFLYKTLNVPWEELHSHAEKLEHVMDESLIERIDALLGHPDFDPHGAPIPRAAMPLPPQQGMPLDAAEPGSSVQVLEVPDSDPDFLSYLRELDLKIGDVVTVERHVPSNGPITLKAGRRLIPVGREVAAEIRVEPVGEKENLKPEIGNSEKNSAADEHR